MSNTTDPAYKECQEYSVETTYDYSAGNQMGNKQIDYTWIFYVILVIILIAMYKGLNYIFNIPVIIEPASSVTGSVPSPDISE